MTKERKVFELLEEIQAICIGADSPDAIDHGERDPIEELQCCREDIAAISNIVEEIQGSHIVAKVFFRQAFISFVLPCGHAAPCLG